jgi:hypothetical protein
VSDLWARLLLSPVIGVIVPNVSGLIDHSRHSAAALVASYAYFTLVSLAVWEGNRQIYFRLQRREDWLLRPWRRVALLLGTTGLFTIPMVSLLLFGWQTVTGDPGARPFAIPMAALTAMTGAVIITHAYETVFLLRDWESDRLRRAHTERARLEAELEALGREVDPHFLFNNLNALVHLVEQKSDAAPAFVTALGETYRYVIESRGCRLVPLSRELDALRRHEMLARIRFGDRVRLSVNIAPADAQRLLLPPVSLGELFHNAIKHNDAQPSLHIELSLDGDTLIFTNDYRPAAGARIESTGVGLSNLAQRFTLATGRTVVCGRRGDRYEVRLPLAS